MKINLNKLPKNVLEITFELDSSDLKPFLEQAAKEMTESKPLTGFRPGKAPYEIVKQRLGEMAIMQHALNSIIAKTYYDYLDKEKINTVEQPKIDVVKLAPENPVVYKATVALLPSVEVTDFRKIAIKPIEEIKIEAAAVDKVLADIQKMRCQEALVEREIGKTDKAEIDFETFIDKIAIAGGKAEKYPLVIGDNHMIEGFEDNLIGLKKDDTKEFELSFPKKYHEEKIAGKKATFKVKVLNVYERKMPELNDELAKSLGLPTFEALKKQIEDNLKHEKEHQAQDKKDVEIITQLIEKSTFGDLPDVLINDEAHKMVHELEDKVTQQGLQFADYLNHLKKKESDLLLDFTPDAIKRVKSSLAIRQIALNEKITIDDKEIDDETDLTLKSYQMNPQYASELKQIEDNIKSPNARRYFENLLINRKVMKLLRKEMVK